MESFFVWSKLAQFELWGRGKHPEVVQGAEHSKQLYIMSTSGEELLFLIFANQGYVQLCLVSAIAL